MFFHKFGLLNDTKIVYNLYLNDVKYNKLHFGIFKKFLSHRCQNIFPRKHDFGPFSNFAYPPWIRKILKFC